MAEREREAHDAPEAERYHAEYVPLPSGEGASLVALQEAINENARHSGKLISALKTPEVRAAPGVFDQDNRDLAQALAGFRVGSFERPEAVPRYEILEETPTEGDGTRSTQLVVDTRSRARGDFTLITRDLKARYAGYDAD